MKKESVIMVKNVYKYFDRFPALKNVSLTVQQGDVFGFIGENGAGKTTLMRMICGLIKPGNGTIEVLGNDMNSAESNKGKRRIGFLPQNVRFHDAISAPEMIGFFAALRDADARESIRFAKELEVEMKQSVRNLSPGQQRKLQLVIATIGFPELLVLDEPTAGLDPMGVQQVRSIIRTLNAKGCTIFISSHVLMELDNICDGVAIIEKGEIKYQGQFRSVYEIEMEGTAGNFLSQLPDHEKGRYEIKGQKLYAGIDREEVPQLLTVLCENGIKVFHVKRQGLEAFYNRFAREGA